MGSTSTYGINYPDSSGYVKDGATNMQTLATNVDTVLGTALGTKLHAGLVLINSTTFSSATTIQLNSIFSATYDNYVIEYRIDTSVADSVYCKMSSGGTPTSGGTAYAYSRTYWTGTSAPANNGGSAGTDKFVFAGVSTTTPSNGSINVYSPYLSAPTAFNGISDYATLGEIMYAKHSASTSYDGLTITCGSAISGTIRIYGKAQS
jgi:hypothetical protein